jgi:hypothetical protein
MISGEITGQVFHPQGRIDSADRMIIRRGRPDDPLGVRSDKKDLTPYLNSVNRVSEDSV